MLNKGLFKKIFTAIFLGLIGLVFGSIAGALFADIGIASYIAWEEILTFLGGIAGIFLGLTYEE